MLVDDDAETMDLLPFALVPGDVDHRVCHERERVIGELEPVLFSRFGIEVRLLSVSNGRPEPGLALPSLVDE